MYGLGGSRSGVEAINMKLHGFVGIEGLETSDIDQVKELGVRMFLR